MYFFRSFAEATMPRPEETPFSITFKVTCKFVSYLVPVNSMLYISEVANTADKYYLTA